MLATEANAFLSREMETEMREGMERRSPIFNPGEPSHHDRLENVNAENDFSGSPARATIPPMSDDDYFSPMSTHGDYEDIGVRGEHAIAFPFEPYDLCDDEDLAEEEDTTNTDIAGASAFDKSQDRRPFIHSPIGNITVSEDNSGAAPSSPHHFPTCPPPPPGRSRSYMHYTPPSHSKRVRVGGSPVEKGSIPASRHCARCYKSSGFSPCANKGASKERWEPSLPSKETKEAIFIGKRSFSNMEKENIGRVQYG